MYWKDKIVVDLDSSFKDLSIFASVSVLSIMKAVKKTNIMIYPLDI